jgi:hypothetical protein
VIKKQLQKTCHCDCNKKTVAKTKVKKCGCKKTSSKKASCHETVRLQFGWCLLDVVAT